MADDAPTSQQMEKRTERVRDQGKVDGLFRACMDTIKRNHTMGQKLRTAMIGAGLFSDRYCYAELLFCFGICTYALEERLHRLEEAQRDSGGGCDVRGLAAKIRSGLDLGRLADVAVKTEAEEGGKVFGSSYCKDLDALICDGVAATPATEQGPATMLMHALLQLVRADGKNSNGAGCDAHAIWQACFGERRADAKWVHFVEVMKRKCVPNGGVVYDYVTRINKGSDLQVAAAVFILWGPLIIGGGYTIKKLVLKSAFGSERCCNIFTLVIGEERAERRKLFIEGIDEFKPHQDGVGAEADTEEFRKMVAHCSDLMDLNNQLMMSVEVYPWWLQWASFMQRHRLPIVVAGIAMTAYHFSRRAKA